MADLTWFEASVLFSKSWYIPEQHYDAARVSFDVAGHLAMNVNGQEVMMIPLQHVMLVTVESPRLQKEA